MDKTQEIRFIPAFIKTVDDKRLTDAALRRLIDSEVLDKQGKDKKRWMKAR